PFTYPASTPVVEHPLAINLAVPPPIDSSSPSSSPSSASPLQAPLIHHLVHHLPLFLPLAPLLPSLMTQGARFLVQDRKWLHMLAPHFLGSHPLQATLLPQPDEPAHLHFAHRLILSRRASPPALRRTWPSPTLPSSPRDMLPPPIPISPPPFSPFLPSPPPNPPAPPFQPCFQHCNRPSPALLSSLRSHHLLPPEGLPLFHANWTLRRPPPVPLPPPGGPVSADVAADVAAAAEGAVGDVEGDGFGGLRRMVGEDWVVVVAVPPGAMLLDKMEEMVDEIIQDNWWHGRVVYFRGGMGVEEARALFSRMLLLISPPGEALDFILFMPPSQPTILLRHLPPLSRQFPAQQPGLSSLALYSSSRHQGRL
ncbi:unnamed protein product, partial [Closterium sp. Naga37s-1]